MPFWKSVGKAIPAGILPGIAYHQAKKSGGLGGLLGGKGGLGGSKGKLKKYNTLNRKQRRTLDKLLGHISPSSFDIGKNKLYKTGSGFLQDMLRSKFQPGFNAMDIIGNLEAPMMRQFREEIIPEIATRFSGLGARNSSAFEQAIGSAGAGLQERLAALRGGLALQAQNDIGQQQGQFVNQQLQAANMGGQYAQMPGQMSFNLAQLGLGTQPFGYQNIAGQAGFGQNLAGGAMQGLGQMLPTLIGGALGTAVAPGVGTLAGAQMGSAIGGAL